MKARIHALVARLLRRRGGVGGFLALAAVVHAQPAPLDSLRVELSWGHGEARLRPFVVRVSGHEVGVHDLRLVQAEPGDDLRDGIVHSQAGGGDIDGLVAALRFEPRTVTAITNAQEIWNYLFEHGDAGATQRLKADPAYRPDPRRLTVALADDETRGFSLTVDQLLTHRAFWFPELGLFVSAGEPAVTLAAHQRDLAGKGGMRVLDRVARQPEATYQDFTSRWEDLGSPRFRNPAEVPPGHIVGIGWDSALHKFGIDRWAVVHPDYGKLDRFRLECGFGDDDAKARTDAWRSQRLVDGLPIVVTTFEREGVRCEIEQFVHPLEGPPPERRGDLPMVLLQTVRFTELTGTARTVPFCLIHQRDLPPDGSQIEVRSTGEGLVLQGSSGRTLLAVDAAGQSLDTKDVLDEGRPEPKGDTQRALRRRAHLITAGVALTPRGSVTLRIKLPSPPLPEAERGKLLAMDLAACRTATMNFWNARLAEGADFRVPDEAVNTLFRANLWHALRLPRRHGGSAPDVRMDLPYSNFAYDQLGTPWPVNQAVYVDYMLYDLRGYHAIAAEELAAIYHNNQEPNGHVGGFANWGVYTPGMLYAVAQHFRLAGGQAAVDRLLPPTLRALDWCLAERKHAGDPSNPAPGLVPAPLNDLSHDARSWAFNQAYFVAGFEALGQALARMGHPRAAECRSAAQDLRVAVDREFGRASVRAPAARLADGTWSPYVPCDAQASGRLYRIWYPTDVDTGPLHLSRLGALDPRGLLTTAMLHDHEDNLFFRQWGMINEPVYNQQATVYLLRDEPKAAIRAFYSMLACAFSHSVFEPVEHRWGWPQYFGPPSTDGAWFELYRCMLVRETADDTLWLAQAAPRAWLHGSGKIEVRRAPTTFGPVTYVLEGSRDGRTLSATVDVPADRPPAQVLVRFRHPEQRPMRSATVDGRPWGDIDKDQEWVRLPRPAGRRYVIQTEYGTNEP